MAHVDDRGVGHGLQQGDRTRVRTRVLFAGVHAIRAVRLCQRLRKGYIATQEGRARGRTGRTGMATHLRRVKQHDLDSRRGSTRDPLQQGIRTVLRPFERGTERPALLGDSPWRRGADHGVPDYSSAREPATGRLRNCRSAPIGSRLSWIRCWTQTDTTRGPFTPSTTSPSGDHCASSCIRPRRWRPSGNWPAAWRTISTISCRPSSAIAACF